jgi:hypothetical protein
MSPEQATAEPVKKKPRGRPFFKGQPRHPNAGRKKGTQGRVVTELREFFRECLNSESFRDHVRKRFEDGTVLDAAHLFASITAHAIGKPRPQEPEQESRPPLLFITSHEIGRYDPLASKAAALLERKRQAQLPATGEAYNPPDPADPDALVVIEPEPGTVAAAMIRPAGR